MMSHFRVQDQWVDQNVQLAVGTPMTTSDRDYLRSDGKRCSSELDIKKKGSSGGKSEGWVSLGWDVQEMVEFKILGSGGEMGQENKGNKNKITALSFFTSRFRPLQRISLYKFVKRIGVQENQMADWWMNQSF